MGLAFWSVTGIFFEFGSGLGVRFRLGTSCPFQARVLVKVGVHFGIGFLLWLGICDRLGKVQVSISGSGLDQGQGSILCLGSAPGQGFVLGSR